MTLDSPVRTSCEGGVELSVTSTLFFFCFFTFNSPEVEGNTGSSMVPTSCGGGVEVSVTSSLTVFDFFERFLLGFGNYSSSFGAGTGCVDTSSPSAVSVMLSFFGVLTTSSESLPDDSARCIFSFFHLQVFESDSDSEVSD